MHGYESRADLTSVPSSSTTTPVVPFTIGTSRLALRHAHHRPAEDDLRGVVGHAAARGEQVAQLRADGDDQVRRLANAGAAHRHDALEQRQPGVEDLGDRSRRSDVLHDDAERHGELARRHFTPVTVLISIFSAPCGYFTVSGRIVTSMSVGRVRSSAAIASGLLRLDADHDALARRACAS